MMHRIEDDLEQWDEETDVWLCSAFVEGLAAIESYLAKQAKLAELFPE